MVVVVDGDVDFDLKMNDHYELKQNLHHLHHLQKKMKQEVEFLMTVDPVSDDDVDVVVDDDDEVKVDEEVLDVDVD